MTSVSSRRVWPVKDDGDRELYALLLRHPQIGAALVDLTRGNAPNTTVPGAAQRAAVVCDVVGKWRARQ